MRLRMPQHAPTQVTADVPNEPFPPPLFLEMRVSITAFAFICVSCAAGRGRAVAMTSCNLNGIFATAGVVESACPKGTMDVATVEECNAASVATQSSGETIRSAGCDCSTQPFANANEAPKEDAVENALFCKCGAALCFGCRSGYALNTASRDCRKVVTGRCTTGDCESGYGVFDYASGNQYAGEWQKDTNNVVQYSPEDAHKDEHDGGLKHGQGTFTWASGAVRRRVEGWEPARPRHLHIRRR